jgi:histidinol-phosphatase (PHP family)
MEEYGRRAKELRIHEIGFSDHINLRRVGDYDVSPIHLFPEYVKNFRAFKDKSNLPVKLGVEIDFFPEAVDDIKRFVSRYPFDYVTGSVHFIGEWMVDWRKQIEEYQKRDIMQIYEQYFGLVQQLCHSGIFDNLGHPDLIKIFGYRPEQDYSHVLAETAEAVADAGMSVEINTSGLRRPCAEIYPSEQFLGILHDYGVPIVFGSDAHEPGNAGRDLDQAVKLAKRVGYRQVCVYSGRRREAVPI